MRAFRWQAGVNGAPGTYQSLGVLGAYPESKATDANNDGSVVVGVSSFRVLSGRAFRWTQGSGMQALDAIPGTVYSEATGIARDGSTIVGYCQDSGGFNNAVVWNDGGMQVPPAPPEEPRRRDPRPSQSTSTAASSSANRGISPKRRCGWTEYPKVSELFLDTVGGAPAPSTTMARSPSELSRIYRTCPSPPSGRPPPACSSSPTTSSPTASRSPRGGGSRSATASRPTANP